MDQFRDLENRMYSKLPNLVLGFHGCSKQVWEKVIGQAYPLEESKNDYDWLGNVTYFWESSCERAWEWANNKYNEDGAVIGAVLDLGHCLNLTDYASSEILRIGYELLKEDFENAGEALPMNIKGRKSSDFLLRKLDCAVIERIHQYNIDTNIMPYDSVRGIFTEGNLAYPGACIYEKTHVQICIRNPNCIKGFFSPLRINENFNLP